MHKNKGLQNVWDMRNNTIFFIGAEIENGQGKP